MLGVQTNFKDAISKFGFKFVDLAVVAFDINNKKAFKKNLTR